MITAKDPKSIQNMFNGIAGQYDRANKVISLGMYDRWNNRLIDIVTKDSNPSSFLDLCGGTGEIAFEYLKRSPKHCHVYLVDFSKDMLACAKQKAKNIGIDGKYHIDYIQADVQKLPLSDNTADCATVAYGIRNVKEPEKFVSETYRTLKPGGSFAILELTRPENPALRLGHTLYLKTMVPLLGKLVTSNKEAYQYLSRSIGEFVSPQVIAKLLEKAGFVKVQIIPIYGGIATIIYGKKRP